MTAAVGPLVVRRRGEVIEILAGNVVLLSSAALETELAFGRLVTLAHVREDARVLVGGLGFGATVRGVLEAMPKASVVVAEKVRAVIDLVRGELAHVQARPLDDPRVAVREQDVLDVMKESAGAFDAVLLDVDNGPQWAAFRTNARLYTPAEPSRRAARSRCGVATPPTRFSPGCATPASLRAASCCTSAGRCGLAPTSAWPPPEGFGVYRREP